MSKAELVEEEIAKLYMASLLQAAAGADRSRML
jgi:hypothetical protein